MKKTTSPLWELREVSKAFPGVQALDDVSLSIKAGEIHALIGENGSGKSTLAKCLAGVHQPESGQLRYEGEHLPAVEVLDSQTRSQDTCYSGNVIYLSTFSKTLAPGIRLAWVIAPPEIIQKLIKSTFSLQETVLQCKHPSFIKIVRINLCG